MLTCLAHTPDQVQGSEYFSLPEIHPALNHLPIAFLIAGVLLDFYAGWRGYENLERIATAFLFTGIITGLVTGAAGFLAFYTVKAHTETAHTLMYWHLGLQLTSILLFAIAAWARWQRNGPPTTGARLVGFIAFLFLIVGSYLGGFIVYQGGAGVNPKLLSPEVREHSHGNSHDSDSTETNPALSSNSLGQ